ncbi:MAG TPA: response regulator transcription factor [Bacteroidota bacterium]|nr:response regulator transcription factor [Bacteroidota bacterium]
MKVLVADDSLIVCARLISMLTDIDGVEIVGQTRNVSGTITSVLTLQPDVVILDIQMPGGTGIDVLTKIREQGSKAIVIILTNYPYPQYRKKCEEAGANFFFDKSNEFESIPPLIQNLFKMESKLWMLQR